MQSTHANVIQCLMPVFFRLKKSRAEEEKAANTNKVNDTKQETRISCT